MSYTKDNPKWVQAQTVKAATLSGRFVDVIAYDETFKNCRVQWGDPFLNKEKSDVLVQNSRGDWLRVWFYDKDILPFETTP